MLEIIRKNMLTSSLVATVGLTLCAVAGWAVLRPSPPVGVYRSVTDIRTTLESAGYASHSGFGDGRKFNPIDTYISDRPLTHENIARLDRYRPESWDGVVWIYDSRSALSFDEVPLPTHRRWGPFIVMGDPELIETLEIALSCK